MGAHATHTIRVKGSDATPTSVTDAELGTITKSFGERTVRTKYEVVKLAEKPADLPTAPKASAKAEKAEGEK
jgi:hypothetical protein